MSFVQLLKSVYYFSSWIVLAIVSIQDAENIYLGYLVTANNSIKSHQPNACIILWNLMMDIKDACSGRRSKTCQFYKELKASLFSCFLPFSSATEFNCLSTDFPPSCSATEFVRKTWLSMHFKVKPTEQVKPVRKSFSFFLQGCGEKKGRDLPQPVLVLVRKKKKLVSFDSACMDTKVCKGSFMNRHYCFTIKHGTNCQKKCCDNEIFSEN